MRKMKKAEQAVSDVLGTILLLGMAIALFSVLSAVVLTYPFNPSPPTVNIIGFVDENDIVLDHRGGESLSLDTKILIEIAGENFPISNEIPTVGDLLIDSNDNHQWDVGEEIRLDESIVGSIRGKQVTVNVIDMDSNSIIMMGTLQEGLSSPPTLTVDVVGGGFVTKVPNQATYAFDTVVTLTPTADPGWTFDSWGGPDAGDLVDTGGGTWSITMDSDKSVTAHFIWHLLSIDIDPDGSGSVTKNPDQPSYADLTVVTLTANADPGWIFDHWSGDLTGSANPDTIIMDSHKSVTATFTQIEYTLTKNINPIGSGSISTDLSPPYYYNDIVTLTPSPESGQSFGSWSGPDAGDLVDIGGGSWSITMDDDKSVTANFVEILTATEVNDINPGTVDPDMITSSPLDLTATGDPGLDDVTLYYSYWWDTNFAYRKQIDFTEPQGLGRDDTHVLFSIALEQNRLSDENGAALVYNGIQIPFDGYAIASESGWVTTLEGLAEIDISAGETKTCYLYYDPVYSATEMLPTNTGWSYVSDGDTAATSAWKDLTPAGIDCNGNDDDGEWDETYPCTGGDSETFGVNEWCYFKGQTSGSQYFWRDSDDCSVLYVNGMNVAEGCYQEPDTGSYTTIEDRYYDITVYWAENGGDNHMRMALGTSNTNDLDLECYPYYGDEWSIGVTVSGSEEIAGTWYNYGIDGSHPWSWSFNFPKGPGYYEFYSIGRAGGSIEPAPGSADASCHYQVCLGQITYDFSTGAGSDKWAKWWYPNNNYPFNSGLLTPAGTEYTFSSGNYDDIAYDDSDRFQLDNTQSKPIRFRYNIDETESSVSEIHAWMNVDCEGSYMPDVYLYIWNDADTQWELLDSSGASTSYQVLEGTVTTDVADYIDSSNDVYVMFFQYDSGGYYNRWIRIDYTYIEVTSLVPC